VFKYLKSNYWRFLPNTWPDWYYYHKGNLRERYYTWRYWYSPPWNKMRRCPVCAGSGQDSRGYNYVHACDDCNGTGKVLKYPGYHWPYWALKIRWKVEKWLDASKKK